MFGGADREQTVFQDMMVYDKSDSIFRSATASGDVPMPRSGHAVVSYGKYMLLYGGIDFAEEAVYNDLYLLDTGKGIINQPMDVASILRSDAF